MPSQYVQYVLRFCPLCIQQPGIQHILDELRSTYEHGRQQGDLRQFYSLFEGQLL